MLKKVVSLALLWAVAASAAVTVEIPIHFVEKWSGDQPDSVTVDAYINGPGADLYHDNLTDVANSLRWYADSLVLDMDTVTSIEIFYLAHYPGGDTAMDVWSTLHYPDTNKADAGDLTIPTATAIVDEWETQSQADPTGFEVNVIEWKSLTAQVGNSTLPAVDVAAIDGIDATGVNALNAAGGLYSLIHDFTDARGDSFNSHLDSLDWYKDATGDTNSTTGITFAVHEAITARNLARDSTKDDYKADTNQAWASTGGGSGLKPVVIYTIDTSGTDDTLTNVNVAVLDNAETSLEGAGVTHSPGLVTITLDSTTTYQPLAFSDNYFFPDTSFTTTDGNTPDTIVLSGYNVSTTATPSSHQTTLVGQTVLQTDTLANCRVEITLAGATAMYSSTKEYPSGRIVVYSDGNGDWTATIVGTDSLSAYLPSGSNVPTYCVKYLHPSLQPGGTLEACGLSIPANGSTTSFRDILAQ